MDKSIKRKLKGLKAFSIFDLVLLAMLTAASVGFKVVAGNLVRMITGPLGIPGGALAGYICFGFLFRLSLLASADLLYLYQPFNNSMVTQDP